MTTTKQYDYLNRLSSIASSPSNAFTYQYNAANQRNLALLANGSYWRYGYDALGQVTSGNKYWNDETPVAGQQFVYAFDTIGNRTQTEAGGDQTGANLRVANYTNNTLNQITSRGVPAAVDVMGDGLATNGVTVNGVTAYRKVEYFRQQLPVTNTSAAVWDGVTVAATGQTSVTGHVYVPKTPETYTYDLDGDLKSDGRWTNIWDCENRLTNITSLSGAPSGSQLNLHFSYDDQGRRIQKIVYTNNGSAYVGEYTNRFVYDGWNLIGVLDGNGNLLYTFNWGTDLSRSLQGAGGVGGLISMTVYSGSNAGTYFYSYDGNGNVSALVSAANGTTVANYEYGPFGEVLRMTGPMAKVNPFRFSTKYTDDESDLVYYGYRYYNPSTGRWPSRDPIEERGGKNLYGMVCNNPISSVDSLGLCACGPDVTVAVNNTITAIANAFNAQTNAQWAAAKALYLQGNGSWDIDDLYQLGRGNDPWQGAVPLGSGGNCARTVVYDGKCVYASALNYIAWGKMNRLSHDRFLGQSFEMPLPLPVGIFGNTYTISWTLSDAEWAVTYHKNVQMFKFSEEEAEAFDFTAIGYQGSVPWYYQGVAITGGSLAKCSTSTSKPIPDNVLHGHFGAIDF